MKPSAPLCSGMKTNGALALVAVRTPISIASGTIRSIAASSFLGWRNLSSMIARVPRIVSPMVSKGALVKPPMKRRQS